ncbi:MAG: hypothetical protein QMD44_04440 [Thermodesulfovibrionales bacterium]|jgi:uncharacterized membrane protein YidH (DUF202 family)|nr:hypothetical protein [Thermodesulfovibrionales bacterium]
MMTYSVLAERYLLLIEWGVLNGEQLHAAETTAIARGIELERVLIKEYSVPKRILLQALSEYYNRPFVEYDEKMPIPPELLSGLDGERLSLSQWFPIIKDGGTVAIAANNPEDPAVLSEVRKYIRAGRYEFWVALAEDIQWFIQDFLHAKPGLLIGTERTGLAFWRNTMAHWRTRLACYRNDLAKGRTGLAFLRWGLGFIAISDTLMRTHKFGSMFYLYWIMMAAGFFLVIFGLSDYLKIRKSRMRPPEHHTLVEVTSATVHFLENYHFIENTGREISTKGTMLARLGDFLSDHCTILYPSPSSRERTHLARERNVLAAQRTVAACYRTIYARARTGLAFIRTGVSFSSVGFGLMHYFGFSLLTVFDSLLITAGILMVTDGILWYMPVRKEQSEIPRCPVPQ